MQRDRRAFLCDVQQAAGAITDAKTPRAIQKRLRRSTGMHFGIFAIFYWIEADLKPKTVQTFAGHSGLQVNGPVRPTLQIR